MKQLSKEEAIEFYDSKKYESWNSQQIVEFQLFQKKLCMPFLLFHKAISEVLGRPVYTHEFANNEALIEEYFGCKSAPSLKEIIEMIPEEKRIVINASDFPNTEN